MSYLPYYAEQLPKEEEDKAMAAINESEQSRIICLKTLRNMLKGKEFESCLDEEFLLMYLRAHKFDRDKAASSIQTYHKLMKDNPDYFKTCVLDALPKASLNHYDISPFRMKDNSGLFITRYFKIDVVELPLTEKVYLDCVAGLYTMRNTLNQICGYTILADVGDFTISKVPDYTNYTWLTIVASVLLNCPGRNKKIHIINMSEAILSAYKTLIEPFLPNNVVDMLHFHTDFKDLHEFIPPEILPERYGGHLKECEIINGMKNIIQMEDYFRKYFPL